MSNTARQTVPSHKSNNKNNIWDRYYSKGKSKYYWFNKETGESKWEIQEESMITNNNNNNKRHRDEKSNDISLKKEKVIIMKYVDHNKNIHTINNLNIKSNIKSDKKNFFFSNIPLEIRNKLQVDEEALYSITNNRDADKMTELIINSIKSIKDIDNIIITDGTACVGGNTISFANNKSIKKVNSIEIDETRFQMLCHNIHLCNISSDKVKCYHGNYAQGFYEINNQDCIFVDPPWGGPEMMSADKVTFPLGHLSLHDLCYKLKEGKYCKLVALKLSPNYDLSEFDKLKNVQIEVFKDFRKMILVLIKF